MKMNSELIRIFGCLALASGAAWADALPEGYVALDYVRPQAACTQWLDTGYTPKSTDRIEMTVEYNILVRNCALWCARSSNYYNAIVLMDDGSASSSSGKHSMIVDCCRDSSIGRTTLTPEITTGLRYTYIMDCNAATFVIQTNGVEMLKVTDLAKGACTTAGSTLALFNARVGTTDSLQSLDTYNAYGFRVTGADGTVQVDLVPAFETSSACAGFYDKARAKFLKFDETDLGHVKNPFFRAGNAFQGALPPGYTPVGAVSSSGNAIVRLFDPPAATDTLEAKVRFANVSRTDSACIWCARNNGYTETMTLFYDFGNKRFIVDCGNSTVNQGRIYAPFEIDDETFHTLAEDGAARTFSIDGEKVGAFANVVFERCGGWLSLFAANARSYQEVASFCRNSYWISSFRIIGSDGVEKVNLVPCREDRSGLAGLFDTVNGMNYAALLNGDNVNTLDWESDIKPVPPEYRRAKWVRAPGNQYVDTLYTAARSDRLEIKTRFEKFPTDTTPFWTARYDYTDGLGFMFTLGGASKTFTLINCRSGITPKADFVQLGEDYTFTVDGGTGVFSAMCSTGTWDVVTWTPATTGGGRPLVLFAGCYQDKPASYSKGAYRVYSMTVKSSEFGSTRLKLQPCVRKSDKAVGFYDQIGGHFLPFSSDGAEYELEPLQGLKVFIQ